LLAPFRELAEPASWAWSREDGERLWHLGVNTLSLTAGTAALALPIGLCLAGLLFRTTFVGRRWFLAPVLFLMFVPLPVIVSGWQGSLGADGWLPLFFFSSVIDRPWATGMGAAVWIHALAAIPWVAAIVGLGLTWVEPEREDEAALSAGPWTVLLGV